MAPPLVSSHSTVTCWEGSSFPFSLLLLQDSTEASALLMLPPQGQRQGRPSGGMPGRGRGPED